MFNVKLEGQVFTCPTDIQVQKQLSNESSKSKFCEPGIDFDLAFMRELEEGDFMELEELEKTYEALMVNHELNVKEGDLNFHNVWSGEQNKNQ